MTKITHKFIWYTFAQIREERRLANNAPLREGAIINAQKRAFAIKEVEARRYS